MKSAAPVVPVPAEPRETAARIDYIDGLRAIAVLIVLAHHIAEHAATVSNLGGPYFHAVMEGAHGVDLFFVLSGFCLAYPTLKKFRLGTATEFRLTDFASKRLVRIVPPFYLATFAVLAVAVGVPLARGKALLGIPPPLDIVKSLIFIDGHVQLLNGSFWTLMVEFRWYFIFPVLLAVWLKSPRAFCAIGVGSALLYAFTRARGLDLGTLPGFMLGIIAADIFIGGRLRDDIAASLKRFALPLAVLCATAGTAAEPRAMIPGFDGSDVAFAFQPTITGWQLAMFFFVVAAGASPLLRRVLAAPPLIATGVASYSIYLVHEPIVDAVVHKIDGPAGYAVAAAVALTVGFAFWAFAERLFTTGPLRRPLLDAVNPLVRRCFALLGIGDVLRLPALQRPLPTFTPAHAPAPAAAQADTSGPRRAMDPLRTPTAQRLPRPL